VAIRRLGAVRFSALAILVSTLATQAHFLAGSPWPPLAQPPAVLGYAAAMAMFVDGAAGVLALSAAMRRTAPRGRSLIGNLGPILTLFFGWWLLGEAVAAPAGGGGLGGGGGVAVVTGRVGWRWPVFVR
jgi:drug/metabolite transporter (DMT)-like permease